MALKVRNPGAGRRQGFAGEMVSDAALTREYSPTAHLRQAPIDIVGILAARSGVHPATVAAHLAAFGIGGARV